MPDYQFLFCFVNSFEVKKMETQVYSRRGCGAREGRSGYSKHNFFLVLCQLSMNPKMFLSFQSEICDNLIIIIIIIIILMT